jgi:hypothetical protein
LKKLIVLHPDPMSSAVLFVMKKIVSKKFWKKLAFVTRVSDLDSLLAKSSSGDTVSDRSGRVKSYLTMKFIG